MLLPLLKGIKISVMAKLSQGINGPFSGRSEKLSVICGKAYPLCGAFLTEKNPFTPRELQQQAKFRLINKFLKPLNGTLNTTFAHLTVQMSGFNKAFSYNVKNAITGVHPDLRIDYSMEACWNSPGRITAERE